MIDIKIEYYKAANYSLINNRIPICQSLELTNTTSEPIHNILVVCEGEYIKTVSSQIIPTLENKDTVRVEGIEIIPESEKILGLTERVLSVFKIKVLADDNIVKETEYDLELMAFDQWLGTSVLPQNVVSFITPNHPAINDVVIKAANILKSLTGSSQFSEYQTGNTNDVRAQVAAVYGAIHECGIVYRAMPANYYNIGQRVTLPDQVLSGKLGNCIELTILFCSVLESIGINSGIVFQKGHAYLGVWLVDDCSSYSITDDPSFLEKKCSRGIDEMLVLESTCVTRESTSFEEAERLANQKLADHSVFEMFVDVKRCRLEKFLPLPTRVNVDGQWKLNGVQHDVCITDIKEHDRYDLSNIADSKRELSKLDIWERKLLDFSLRNSLLNLYLRRKAIQFISFDIDRIEDHLADNEEYCILPKPNVEFKYNTDERLVRSKLAEPLKDLITDDIEHHRLHTYQTEAETKNTLKNIYRAAKNAIEETGANSLFLAIGTLRWYENPRSEIARFAPIILLPVEMVYKKGNYYIRTRDEETSLNITLIEFLRQNLDIKINGLDPLPKDDHGVDVPKIFAIIRNALREQKKWDVEEECLLGTFSFSKFLMWNDVHNHREELLQNKVVSSLVNNKLTWTPEPVCQNLKELDSTLAPTDIALPVPVDSSQMSAVIEAGQGRTFILYGPPGTGKSQTITNLIANALFHGKRVLFVAEKMAALSVVQSRLEKINLGPFCLEMHSNKVTKKHVLEQLDSALKARHIVHPEEYKDRADRIFAQRTEMIKYINALHDVDSTDGLSLYDCIVRYESIDGEPLLGFESNEVLDASLAKNGTTDIDELLGSRLDTILKLIGQPSESPLRGLRIEKDNYNPEQLVDKLKDAKLVLEQAHKDYSDLDTIKKVKNIILKDNDIRILDVNAKSWYDEWRSIKTKWFLPKFFAKRNYLKKLKEYNQYIIEDDIDQLLGNLLEYNEKNRRIETIRDVYKSIFGLLVPVEELPERSVFTESIQRLESWISNKDSMRDWIHWCDYTRELEKVGLDFISTTLESVKYSGASLSKSFYKSLYKHKAEKKINSNPVTATFRGLIFEETIKSYKKYAEEFQTLTQKELYARLVSGVPRVGDNTDSSSEIGILNRNISNGGRGMSLRDLLDQIPTLLPKLCPCMLMSPMSVAQYLDLSQEKFDLVVFDEASQMPTSEAVGAIARGKALVVVGDPKQMPPTSFFSSTNVDEEEASIDDMESILEDCRTLEIPSLQLNWHYRSKHESLIAFSNNEYYDGSLITFPSIDDKKTKVGYVPVNGFYDKGGKRNNLEEANAIVAEIERRLRDENLRRQSIGVIAFSVVQQSLIEDLLQDKFDSDRVLKEFADSMYEPIFVKNLENVQGDERDIILFSIGYGPNQEGKVSMNFGPLNNSGGERRLNVAVSRARYEMIVYSTIKSSQIDLKRSKARGVEGLKHFLEYAETQNLVKSSSSVKMSADTEIAVQIAKAIEKQGFIANIRVGRSNFKVDIAVSRKDSPEEYILGILLDGEGYRDTQTTRDREIVQPTVLKMLNWKVKRVWSVDWYNNPQSVIDDILEELQLKVTTSKDQPQDTIPYKSGFDVLEEKEEVVTTNAIEYKEYQKGNRKNFEDDSIVNKIVEVEQPITLMSLARKICILRGFPRVIPSQLEQIRWYSEHYLYLESDMHSDVVWQSMESSKDYPWYRPNSGRDISDIPLIEIMNAAKEAISEQVAISLDSLTLLVAKKLGFTRRGTKVEAAIQCAITQLKNESVIVEDSGKIKIIGS